jgi:hypothetical protein
MSEPKTKLVYELIDDEGKPVAVTPELEMDAHEKDRGAVGMLEWCKRVADRMGRWGFLLEGGKVTASKVKVSLMIFEEQKWQSLMDMSMRMGDDGFVRISGQFPVVII